MKYEFVRCNSCDWYRDYVHALEWGRAIAEHAETNCVQMAGIMLPMWSVAWPYYHAPATEKKWGIEMEWRPVGTHSVIYNPIESGASEKKWYLLPRLTDSLAIPLAPGKE